MKTLFKILSTLAFALVLFVPAKNASAGDNFPPGVSFNNVVGKTLDPAWNTNKRYTTLDSVDFGFKARYVRICLHADSAQSYFRFGTTVSEVPPAAGASRDFIYTVPSSTSAIFINGGLAANGLTSSFDWAAIPMRGAITSDGAAAADVFRPNPICTTQPWRTRGIVMHIASGFATADVWGYQ